MITWDYTYALAIKHGCEIPDVSGKVIELVTEWMIFHNLHGASC
jgi:hypothetical protein